MTTGAGPTRSWILAAALVLMAAVAAPVAALQVAPNHRWRTFTTEHFHVHFTPEVEELARRTATIAERAHRALSGELRPPRGRIDIVLADNRDVANGYATVYPTNRIVIYAVPPFDTPMLRGAADWLENIVVHELVHIFHLDRVGGIWKGARLLFGRNPAMMPSLYSPAWLREGLAVYYESLLTGSGRLQSGEHHMIRRGVTEGARYPALGDMNLSTSQVPEGHTAYVFGAEVVAALAAADSTKRVDDFIASMSASLIPWNFSSSAKRKLGMSFGSAVREGREGSAGNRESARAPVSEWRDLVTGARVAWHPRWLHPDTLMYVRSDGRSVTALHKVTPDGRSLAVSRRNGTGVNAPLADGRIVFAQQEFTDPYTIRSDLYIREPTGDGERWRERRLTEGARLAAPSVRQDGEILAVQLSGGYSSVVRLAVDDPATVTPVLLGGPLHDYTDPSWSPDGSRFVAVRRVPGATNAVVMVEEDGEVIVLLEESTLLAAPVFLDNDNVVFVRDSGRPQLYVLRMNGASGAGSNRSATPLTFASTGVVQPAPWTGGSDGRYMAAVTYGPDGYRLGIADTGALGGSYAALSDAPTMIRGESLVRGAEADAGDSLVSRAYSPFRLLLPRHWVPLLAGSGNGGTIVGAVTEAMDVVDRHAWSAQLLYNSESRVLDAAFGYAYAGLGIPVLGASVSGSSEYTEVLQDADGGRVRLGFLREKSSVAALSLRTSRPRFRSSAAFAIVGEYERVSFDSRPAAIIELLELDLRDREYGAVSASASWSNARRPSLSISPEDGVSLAATIRERWRLGSEGKGGARTVTGSVRAFKSLDLPGFAHHVLAARVAAGGSGSAATSRLSVGGKSGTALEVFPGYSVGDSPRTFPVRGFESGVVRGLRAVSGSLEYRVPLFMVGRGLGMIPLFVDRASASGFVDMGSAWCPAAYADVQLCRNAPGSARDGAVASFGAEFNLDSALQYDSPYRLRFGVAVPWLHAGERVGGRGELYFSLGFPF